MTHGVSAPTVRCVSYFGGTIVNTAPSEQSQIRTVNISVAIEPFIAFSKDIASRLSHLINKGIDNEIRNFVVEVVNRIRSGRGVAKVDTLIASGTSRTVVLGPSRELLDLVETFLVRTGNRQK